MNWETIARQISQTSPTKIVLLVMDGLGGLPLDGRTELETARTPHLDALAKQGACGLTDPVLMGVTPGSGPSHLALFGYNPTKYILGRGILEALGVGVEVGENDLVARGNFATFKADLVKDRRAGRLPTEDNEELCRYLSSKIPEFEGTRVAFFPGKEHRFVLKLSGPGLSDALSDADPQKNDAPRVPTAPLSPEAEETAVVVNGLLDKITELLQGSPKAGTVLLRGFARYPSLPTLPELYRLKPAAIAHYPMYKGLARLVGMEILPVGPQPEDLFNSLEQHFENFDFFYIHVKKTDSAGEDGDFDYKVRVIEQTDSFIPRLLELKPDVLAVTSDHSTPAVMKAHSWHPNPFLLHSRLSQTDDTTCFSEKTCAQGYLGRFPAVRIMPLLLAHAEKLNKFGA